jgi:hypothetical protein
MAFFYLTTVAGSERFIQRIGKLDDGMGSCLNATAQG